MGREINRARFTGLDFDTIEDDLRARLQVKFAADFNDFAVSQLGILLMDMVSFGLDTLTFSLDRRTSDTYLQTARTRKSVSRLTRQIGYKMGAAVSSSVDLRVSLEETFDFNVPVPGGFQFLGPNDLIFEAAESVTFPAGSGPSDFLSIPCYEGETITETFVSDGQSLQRFELRRVPDQKFIVQGTVVVTVDGTPWEESEFITFDELDQFEINYNGEPPTISFGDGVAGNIPPTNASIVVTYVASRGLAGLVNKETIEEVVNPLVVNFTPIDLIITNPNSSVAGDDPETIESAKVNGPKVFKTRGVNVTREDYESRSRAFADPLFGRVAVAHAFSSRSADTDLVVQSNLISIQGACIQPLAIVDTEAPAIEAELATISAQTTQQSTDTASIVSAVGDIDTDLSNTIDSAREVKDRADEIVADSSGIGEKVSGGKAAVDAITTGASSALTTADKDAIKDFFDRINTESGSISTAATSMKSSVDAQIADVGNARTALDEIVGTTGEISRLNAAVASIDSSVTVIQTSVANIEDTIEDTTATVSAATEAINEHFDKILAADCKANLVTVPILARDAAGFYAAPSLGLINALQTFLEENKEVTQVVEVVSGEDFLIPAVITIRVGVLPGNAESTVGAAVESVVDTFLRDRAFGRSLYRSNVIDAITGTVSGIDFANVTLEGHLVDGVNTTAKLDGNGNLIVGSTEVVTKGTVSVTTELSEPINITG